MPDLDLNPNVVIPDSSQIKRSGFNTFMGSLFGWRRNKNTSSAKDKIEFVKVDLGSDERVSQAFLNSKVDLKHPLNQRLDQLFDYWLSDNTDKFTELQERANRINQLSYMYLTDPYINRVVAMYADEATQLDSQDTVINIETPDPRMTRDMYNLLNLWGITTTRIRATIEQMVIYGDAFWTCKVTDRGVEGVKLLQQTNVVDRIEFNPARVLEAKRKREGGLIAQLSSNNYLVDQMFKTLEDTSDIADIFDSKLFGFSIEGDLVVPPWLITHFRVGAEGSQFYPWGTSILAGCITPFKQVQSSIALQGLAKSLRFPITLYKVKTSENMDEGRQFNLVNRVREEYDNIGISPSAGTSEVYTVNTKIWIPDGLLDVEIKEPSSAGSDSVDDVKLYQDRLAVAAGIPKSFFSEEWYGFGESGKALAQQYKPFGRRVFSLQTAFLESLADLFRTHFAITGEYDFRIPFTLSMRYPAVEEDSNHADARLKSVEIAEKVIEIVKNAIGAGEDEGLPPDIVRDILAKYSFLDVADLMKWTRDAKFSMPAGSSEESEEGGNSEGGIEGEFGGGFEGAEDLGNEEAPSEEESGEEITVESRKTDQQRLREKRLCENYKEQKDKIYFKILQENAISSFTRNNQHVEVCDQINESIDIMLETLDTQRDPDRLREYLK